MGYEVAATKAVELDAFGDFDELEKMFDMSKAREIDITDMDNFEESAIENDDDSAMMKKMPSLRNDLQGSGGKKKKHEKGPRSAIVMSNLFGSHKIAYKLPDTHDPKREKKTFSHKRIFGVAKTKTAQQANQ